jgi:4-amino-4-deoxychorismate lyase
MSLLIESIKLLDGRFCNLFYHEQRMNRSLKTFCGIHDHFLLEEFLNEIKKPVTGLYKCRIVYDDQMKDVEFIPYIPKEINTLRIIKHDHIHYEFKYVDRKTIDRLYELRKDNDDILIVKRGLVTDSSYSNIVFKKGKRFYTPSSCLLKGTMRQNLLERGLIEEKQIYKKDIKFFETFKLINAMVEFRGPEIDISKISFD